MKKKLIIAVLIITLTVLVISLAFIVKGKRDENKDPETYTPAPGEHYDPDQLEWDPV